MIGQYVESDIPLNGDGTDLVAGLVVGVRFDNDGVPLLQLDSGTEMPLSDLRLVTSLERIAESLVGKLVTAEVLNDGETQQIEGLVMAVTTQSGKVMLELDTGEQVALSQVRDWRSPSQSASS